MQQRPLLETAQPPPPGPVLALRDYQEGAIACVLAEAAAGVRRPLVVLPTGTGKTVVFCHLARRMGCRTLILAHRDELIQQAAAKFRQVDPQVDLGIVKAEADQHARRVVVASVQTLAQPHRLARLRRDFGLIVIDECFPAGTLIGDTPIELVKPGDLVPSYDERSGMLVSQAVVRLFRRRPSALMTLHLSDGRSITCTPNHPLYTPAGWVPAGHAAAIGWVLAIQEENVNADLLSVWRPDDDHGQASRGSLSEDWPGLLFRRVPGRMGETGSLGAHGTNQSSARQRADAGAQSDGSSGSTRADARVAAGAGVRAEAARGERPWPDGTAGGAGRGAGLADGGDRTNAHPARLGTPDALQARPGGSLAEDSDRGGRELPPLPPGPGCAERRVFTWARVDRLAVHQPGSDGTFGGLCPEGVVYNFEVAGTHTYLAGGVVAHNCHHATSKTYKTILRHFGSYDAEGPLTVGVTATPDRGDGVGLKSVFQKIVYQRGLLEMIRAGYLCPLRGVEVQVDADLAALPTRRGDIVEAAAGAALLEAHAPEAIAAAYRHHAGGLRAVVFTPTVAMAEATAAAFRAVGVAAKSLDGLTPTRERRAILAGLADGTTPVVVNCGVLTEGFDEPQIRCVIIARPTKSRALYTQMVGRGTRLADGKKECVVLDVVGATRQHQLVTVATLVGRAAREAKRQDKRAAGSTKGAAPPLGLPVDPQRLRSAAVDLFAGSALRWLQAGRSTFILALRDGWLLVEPELAATDLWRVVQREGRYAPPEVLVGELDLVTAQALADDVARGLGPPPRDQRWRERPASPGQLDALNRWHVAPAEGLTSGEASDQLTAIAAIATWRKAQRGR